MKLLNLLIPTPLKCGIIILILFFGPFIGIEDATLDVSNYSYIMTSNGYSGAITSVAWNPNSSKIVSGSVDGTISIWSGYTGGILKTFKENINEINSVDWSPDGSKIVSGQSDNSIRIIDAETGTNLKTLIGHNGIVYAVKWSPDGTKIASGSEDRTIKIWDAMTGSNLKTLIGHSNQVRSIGWSPNSTLIASGSDDMTIKVWVVGSGAVLKTLIGHTESVLTVTWDSNGKRIASGSDDKTIRTWDIATGENKKTFVGDAHHVLSIAWSPNGNYIASGGFDNITKIWDAENGTILKNLTGHNAPINSVAWNLNGSEIASGSSDHTIKIWGKSYIILYVKNFFADKSIITIGDPVTLTAIFTNNGTANYTNEAIFYDGVVQLGTHILDVNRGETRTIQFTWVTAGYAYGKHNIIVKTGKIEKTILVEIVARVSNVYIQDLNVDKSNITIGDSLIITAIIINNGTANASNINVKFFDGNALLTTLFLNIAINKKIITNFIWNTNNSTLINTHIFRVVTGKREKDIFVNVKGKPNVFVKDLIVDKKNITVGENVTLSVDIINNGTANATNISVQFYDGTLLIGTYNISVLNIGEINISNIWDSKNVTIGKHNLNVVVEQSIKETTITVNVRPKVIKPHIKTTVENEWIIWFVLIVLFIIALLTFVRGMSGKKGN